jgi:excisionase family DNA binding protein
MTINTFAPIDSTQAKQLLAIMEAGRAALLSASGKAVLLPPSVQEMLRQAIDWLGTSRSVTLTADAGDKVITTQRAAELLGMSRPSFIKLLSSGAMPVHRVGAHRRVFLRDVLGHARQRDEASQSASEAARQSVKTQVKQ